MLRVFLLAGTAICAGSSTILHAQTSVGMPDPQQASETSEIIVTGTRSAGREALASSAPIDVVTAEALSSGGFTDLGRSLNFLEPSINFARSQTTATAANTRPVTLRGLSPDQTLVLVNGKRRHANAVLNVNNSIGRGAAAVDLDTIPESAIDHIEILRDGAAAQYGSDAIAGVVNIILKSNASGGSGDLIAGVTEQGDGDNLSANLTGGISLGDGGHLTLSGSFRTQRPTNRAHVDQRYNRVTYRIGDPDATVGSVAYDLSVPMGDLELYSFATITRKISNNGAGFRIPGFSPVYPNGFLPIIEPRIWDFGVAAGVKGKIGGINVDLSETFGDNKANFYVRSEEHTSELQSH